MHGEIGRTQKMINAACDKWMKDKGYLQSRGIGFLFNREQLASRNKSLAKPKATPKPRELKPKPIRDEIKLTSVTVTKSRQQKSIEQETPKNKYKSEESKQRHLQQMREWRLSNARKITEEEKEAKRIEIAARIKQKSKTDYQKRKAKETLEQKWDRLERSRQYRIKQKEKNEAAKM